MSRRSSTTRPSDQRGCRAAPVCLATRCAARPCRDARPSGCLGPLRAAEARTGELRVGINARLAKQALAQAFGLEVEAVEEVWHGLRPPFTELFDWAEGRAEQPAARDVPVFRPFMLAHPLDETSVSLEDYAAEWKWDGIRVQLVHAGGETRLYSRTGDDISGSFPDVAEAFRTPGVLDGELLVRGRTRAMPTCMAGRRRASTRSSKGSAARRVSAKMLGDYPAFVRLYDMLFDGEEDLRGLPWERAAVAAGGIRRARSIRSVSTLSALIDAATFEELEEIALGARDAAIEGVMLKRRDSLYVARPAGRACGTNGSAIR